MKNNKSLYLNMIFGDIGTFLFALGIFELSATLFKSEIWTPGGNVLITLGYVLVGSYRLRLEKKAGIKVWLSLARLTIPLLALGIYQIFLY